MKIKDYKEKLIAHLKEMHKEEDLVADDAFNNGYKLALRQIRDDILQDEIK